MQIHINGLPLFQENAILKVVILRATTYQSILSKQALAEATADCEFSWKKDSDIRANWWTSQIVSHSFPLSY